MSTEAERKARQRQGYVQLYFEVHMPSLTAALLAEGLITDSQLEDRDAIRKAGSRFIAQHCKVGRLLRDGAEQRERAHKSDRPKAKRQDRPKHGPVRHWTPEEIEAWESGQSRPGPIFNWPPSYYGIIAGDPVGLPPEDAMWTVLSELPPDWSARGKSGDRDGRNRSRITGAGSKKESAAKKIEQLDDKALKRAEQPYADRLKVKSTSPHFVQTSAKELRSMHGLNSTEESE